MRLDLTINIPTILTLILLVATTTATGFNLYYGLERRQTASDFAVAELARRIDKNEIAVSTLKTDAATNNASLRGEMKSDIQEIKEMLNRLIFAPQPQVMNPRQRQQLKEWSK